MLYIASALTPTPILITVQVDSFTSADVTSLIVAKSDRVEVWDVDKTGLVWRAELELWGSVIGIEKVLVQDAPPHILVLLSPPNAHLLLLAFSPCPTPSLIVTSSLPLTPPTPSLRQAEFFASIISQDSVALVSLWVGVLSCIDMEVEKDKDAKKRRESNVGMKVEDEGKRLKFRDNFNINIREHNLLHLAFLPSTSIGNEPMLTFLWLSSESALQLQTRKLSINAHSFTDASRAIDVVAPVRSTVQINAETDFNDVPFSCPAARRVLPIPTTGNENLALVVGDEHSVLYSISRTPQSPRISRLSSSTGIDKSPRASATRRSPQTEMMGSVGKRRKSSTASKSLGENGDKWEVRPVWRVRQGFGTVLAATVLESHASGASVILGDENGRLTAIGWEFEGGQGILDNTAGQNGTVRVRKAHVGTSSPPSSLNYLGSSHLFLSSACGDSLLLRLKIPSQRPGSPVSPSVRSAVRPIPARKGKGRAREDEDEGAWSVVVEDMDARGKPEIKERWMNLAPVKDFCVVGEEGGGVSHLVVASGASNSNSLRVVRSGVGLEEVVNVEGMNDVTGMWTLTTTGTTSLLLSTSTSTTLLSLDPEIVEAEASEKITSQPTLATGLLAGGTALIQVTPRDVKVWSNIVAGTSAGTWEVGQEQEIIAAQVQGELAVVAKRGGELVVLVASESSLKPVVSCDVRSEISSLSVLSVPTLPSPIIAVGNWSNEILLYTLDHLRFGESVVTTISESFYASSLMLKPSVAETTSTSGVQLIAGLSDGSMIIYDVDLSGEGGGLTVKGRKASSLGTRPLRICSVSGASKSEEKIIAVGLSERMSVIFEAKDRVDFSSVSKKDVTAAEAISSASLGDCLVLATPSGLSFSKVNSLKKLHVQTLDLKDRSASKLVSLPEHKLLGIGATNRTMDPQTGDVMQSGHFELRDETSLELLAQLHLEAREEVTCLNDVFLLGRHYIAVGTAIFPSDEEFDQFAYAGGSAVASKEGRLLLIEPVRNDSSDRWDIKISRTLRTAGPVRDAKVIHGFLAVASTSKVGFRSLDFEGDRSFPQVSIHRLELNPPDLIELSAFSSAFITQYLHVASRSKLHNEDRLVVGDGMRSVFVLDVDEASGKIFGDQRDMATHSVTALEGIRDGGDGVVIADGYSNLLTFRLKEQIESAATFGLHEDVARFRPGSLAPPSSAPDVINPDLLFATTDGRLGIIGELTAGAAKTMDDLQRNMDKYYKGPGGTTWKTFRRGGTQLIKKETAGFIDGDFIQKFLDADLIPSAEAEKILTGSNQHEHVSRLAADGSGTETAERGDVARVLEAAAGLH